MSTLSVQELTPDQHDRWNAFVDRSPQGAMFCYTWWLEATAKSRFTLLAAVENGAIAAGMPLALDGQGRINVPPLTRTLGVLYRPQDGVSQHRQLSNQRRWLAALLDHVPRDRFVQTCLHHSIVDWLPFKWRGFQQTTRYTYVIEYGDMTEGDLRRRLSKGMKSTINGAVRNGIRVEQSDDFELLYRFEELSYERQGLRFNVPYADLQPLDDAIKKNGCRVIFKAVDASGRAQAMIYVASTAKSAFLLLSGSDARFRRLGGHSLALWEAVKHFRGRSACMNFCGSDIPAIEQHIRCFGGTLTPYFHIFNEDLMEQKSGVRHHLDRAGFHLHAAWAMAKNRLFRITNKRAP